MKNVLNAVVKIKHLKEILNLNIMLEQKLELYYAVNVDTYSKAVRIKKKKMKIKLIIEFYFKIFIY